MRCGCDPKKTAKKKKEEEDVIYVYIYIHTHTHNRILHSHKKNKVMLFAVTWMSLEITTLSEVSQTKTSIIRHA